MIKQLRQRLQAYHPRDLAVDLPEAAVLMPLTDSPDPEMILTVRAATMPTHAGEVAFPGGKRDAVDADLLATALRESEEEVSLPPDQVEILAQLSPVVSRFGLKVTPFVGLVAPDVALVPEPGELESIFRVPLRFFLDTPPEMSSPVEAFGRRLRIPNFYYEGNRIWGLTAFMILDLLNHVYDAGIRFEEPICKHGENA